MTFRITPYHAVSHRVMHRVTVLGAVTYAVSRRVTPYHAVSRVSPCHALERPGRGRER